MLSFGRKETDAWTGSHELWACAGWHDREGEEGQLIRRALGEVKRDGAMRRYIDPFWTFDSVSGAAYLGGADSLIDP